MTPDILKKMSQVRFTNKYLNSDDAYKASEKGTDEALKDITED